MRPPPTHAAQVAVALGLAGAMLAAGCERSTPADAGRAVEPETSGVVDGSKSGGGGRTSGDGHGTPAALSTLADEGPPLDPQRATWGREAALERLPDPALAVSAALRLAELAGVSALSAPADPSPGLARRLAVAKVGERYALGLRAPDATRLAAPLLIAADGAVEQPCEGLEEELAVLHVSGDGQRFPDVLVTPVRVLLVGEETSTALAARRIEPGWFELQTLDGRAVIVAAAAGDDPARRPQYRWDAVEQMFIGPERERLGGVDGWVELDMQASVGLVPVGGELPEPPAEPDWEAFPPAGEPARQPL